MSEASSALPKPLIGTKLVHSPSGLRCSSRMDQVVPDRTITACQRLPLPSRYLNTRCMAKPPPPSQKATPIAICCQQSSVAIRAIPLKPLTAAWEDSWRRLVRFHAGEASGSLRPRIEAARRALFGQNLHPGLPATKPATAIELTVNSTQRMRCMIWKVPSGSFSARTKNQRFKDKYHHGKDKPDYSHRVEPPRPQVEVRPSKESPPAR